MCGQAEGDHGGPSSMWHGHGMQHAQGWHGVGVEMSLEAIKHGEWAWVTQGYGAGY